MVAEDQLINLEVMKNQISELSLANKTTYSNNGQDLIDKVKTILSEPLASDRPIDLILTDFQMPKKNGIEALNEIRALFKAKSTELGRDLSPPHFVFLTAYYSQAFVKHLNQLGQTEIYEKPLHD